MKESSFIKENLESWNEYERIISLKENKPNKLSKLFIKITDDLSYAYTYYNTRSVRVYLNSFAKVLYHRVNRSEGFRFSRIRKFFTHSVPLSIYEARREFLVAFLVFSVAMVIGILSSKYDSTFPHLILGEDYMSMTKANIEKNDPMAVYKSRAPFDMFFAITINNCLVAVRTFVLGLFMAVGTLVILLYNGIMLGAFQYYFVEQGLFRESFLTIWQHGVFEISSIILAGAAGLVLGKGLVFPGNFTRFQSLRISARRGLRLILGLIPVLIVAGFIEGFYTRFTTAPDLLRVGTILISVVFITGYYIVLPRYRGRRQSESSTTENTYETPTKFVHDSRQIYSGPQIFMLSFQVLKPHFGRVVKWTLLLAVVSAVLLFLLNYLGVLETYEGMLGFRPIKTLQSNYLVPVIQTLLFSLMGGILLRHGGRNDDSSTGRRGIIQFFRVLVLFAAAHAWLMLDSPFFAVLLFLVSLQYLVLVATIMAREGKGILSGVATSFFYLKGSFGKWLLLTILYLILGLLFYFVFMRLIAAMNNELVQMNLYGSEETGKQILFYIDAWYFNTVLLFALGLSFFGTRVLYFSLYETYHAEGLIEKISRIGKTKRIRGLVRE